MPESFLGYSSFLWNIAKISMSRIFCERNQIVGVLGLFVLLMSVARDPMFRSPTMIPVANEAFRG